MKTSYPYPPHIWDTLVPCYCPLTHTSLGEEFVAFCLYSLKYGKVPMTNGFNYCMAFKEPTSIFSGRWKDDFNLHIEWVTSLHHLFHID